MRHSIEGYVDSYPTPYPGGERLSILLDALQGDHRLGVHRVTEDGGRLVGFASLYACLDTLVADRILVMNDLFVTPPARGAGHGAALLAGAKAYAAESGYVRLDWVTADDNPAAQRFYDRHGGHRGPWGSYSLPVT